MNIIDAIAGMINVDPLIIPKMIAENGRFEIECEKMGYKIEMPVIEMPSLLRIGKRLYIVTWKNAQEHSSVILTQEGS